MSNSARADGGRFEAAYRAGVTEEVAPPAAEGEGLRELVVRAAPTEAVALHGCVLTPARAVENAYVVIDGTEIQGVSEKRPEGCGCTRPTA